MADQDPNRPFLVGPLADIHRFGTLLNARRLLRDVEHERQGMTFSQVPQKAANAWHGVRLGQPDWSDHSHSLAFEAELPPEGLGAYMILNASWETLDFELPGLREGRAGAWCRWIAMSLASPGDIVSWQDLIVLIRESERK